MRWRARNAARFRSCAPRSRALPHEQRDDDERRKEAEVGDGPPVRRDRLERGQPPERIETEDAYDESARLVLERGVERRARRGEEERGAQRAHADEQYSERAQRERTGGDEAVRDERRDEREHVDDVAVRRRVATLPEPEE